MKNKMKRKFTAEEAEKLVHNYVDIEYGEVYGTRRRNRSIVNLGGIFYGLYWTQELRRELPNEYADQETEEVVRIEVKEIVVRWIYRW